MMVFTYEEMEVFDDEFMELLVVIDGEPRSELTKFCGAVEMVPTKPYM